MHACVLSAGLSRSRSFACPRVCRVPCAVCRVPCAVCRVPCAVHLGRAAPEPPADELQESAGCGLRDITFPSGKNSIASLGDAGIRFAVDEGEGEVFTALDRSVWHLTFDIEWAARHTRCSVLGKMAGPMAGPMASPWHGTVRASSHNRD